MLDAIEGNAKGNDSFVIKVISAVNIDGKSYIFKKNMEEIRRKNQTYLFHFLIYYLERLV